ncbi:hypothetical protein Efla_001045 [Eimeria flavescens]
MLGDGWRLVTETAKDDTCDRDALPFGNREIVLCLVPLVKYSTIYLFKQLDMVARLPAAKPQAIGQHRQRQRRLPEGPPSSRTSTGPAMVSLTRKMEATDAESAFFFRLSAKRITTWGKGKHEFSRLNAIRAANSTPQHTGDAKSRRVLLRHRRT